MRNRTKTVLASAGVAALIVVGTDAMTYAATGDSLLLGKTNKANQTTHVTNTGNGPALSLHAKGKRPALAVDSKAKVVRLNADRVDGKHASGLQNNVRVYVMRSGSTTDGYMDFRLPTFPTGRYQATYDVLMGGTHGTAAEPTYGSCYLQQAGPPSHAAYTETTSVSLALGLSGSDIINKGADDWMLRCAAFQVGVGLIDWNISSTQPVRITLTRIDKTIGGKLTLARTGLGAHRLGQRH